VAVVVSMLGIGAAACGVDDPLPPADPCKPVQTEAKVTIKPWVLPFKATISSSGKITVEFSAEFVIPGATIGVGLAGSHNLVPSKPSYHLLLIRTIEDGEVKETPIEIKCDNEYRVFINGQVDATITTERTTIEARPGVDSTVAIVDKASRVDPDLKPLPEYELVHDREQLELPDPLGLYGVGMDLDAFRSGKDMPSEDADVRYDFGDGLESGFHSSVGFTDREAPTPQECPADAEARPIGRLPQEDIRVGQRFCVVTSKSNVAFLKVTARRGPYPGRYKLSFQASAWTKVG
jgi:hypothetical protein